MNGLYLQGGGAKGAFQAGVIYGLIERGIKFNIISGTSIGAINGYYIYTDNMEELKETWLSIDENELGEEKIIDKVIENKMLIEKLNDLEGKNKYIEDFYVNYINIENNEPKQVVKNICKLSKTEALNTIKYSSLLPYIGQIDITLRKAMKSFDSSVVFEKFKEELSKGGYNGYNLDGGILNNNFLESFIEKKVDKLYIIQFKKDYEIPQYILENYNRKNLIIIEPDIAFEPKDTLRFEKGFCRIKFNEGYNLAKDLKL